MINLFENKIKFIFDSQNHNIFFFLMGCSSLFFCCQILKTSTLIENDYPHFKSCTNYLNKYLVKHQTLKVCEILNNKEDFQNFVYNYFYTILLMYSLIREVINKTYFDLKYWILAHIALIGYSLSGNYSAFQFSIELNRNYNDIQIKIIIITSILIGILLIRQIYLNKIKNKLIINFLSIFLVMYILLLSITNKIKIHFHHALVCGILSLCFTDFKSILDKYIHSLLIGITVQGFNMYSLSEVYMFYIDDIAAPSFLYLIIMYVIFLVCWFGLIFLRNKKCIKKKLDNDISILETNDITIQMPLIPSKKDIESYKREY